MSSNAAESVQPDAEIAQPSSAAEAVRGRLRDMMLQGRTSGRPNRSLTWQNEATAYDKLRATALIGVPALFDTALADLLGITLRQSRQLTGDTGFDDLSTALNASGLDAEEAFVITAAIFPSRFGHPESIRLFLERFNSMNREEARAKLRDWKGDTLATALQTMTLKPQNTNRPDDRTALKAS